MVGTIGGRPPDAAATRIYKTRRSAYPCQAGSRHEVTHAFVRKNTDLSSLNEKIKDFIRSRIEDGSFQVDDRIPSEAELALQFGASRMTVNRAIKELSERGLIVRRQGVGSFVAPRTTHAPLFEIRSLSEDIRSRGGTHACHVMRLDRVRPGEAAARFGFARGRPVFYLEALHTADGRPLQLERRHVDGRLAPSFLAHDFTAETASDFLVRTVAFTEVEHTVDALGADAAIAGALAVPPGDACLRLTRRTHLDATLVTHVELIHAGSRFSLTGRFAGAVSTARVA